MSASDSRERQGSCVSAVAANAIPPTLALSPCPSFPSPPHPPSLRQGHEEAGRQPARRLGLRRGGISECLGRYSHISRVFFWLSRSLRRFVRPFALRACNASAPRRDSGRAAALHSLHTHAESCALRFCSRFREECASARSGNRRRLSLNTGSFLWFESLGRFLRLPSPLGGGGPPLRAPLVVQRSTVHRAFDPNLKLLELDFVASPRPAPKILFDSCCN